MLNNEFEEKIGYRFSNPELLERALTHSSYAHEKKMKPLSDNERLEFLGDAVLELVSSDFLFETYPDVPEGKLTKTRAALVCEPTLAFCATEISLGRYIKLGKGEDSSGGRARKSVLSDALEAVIGALYLDGGLSIARAFIMQFILNDIENKQIFYDSKSVLQERLQSIDGQLPEYVLVGESGPDHNKIYEVNVLSNGSVIGSGKGASKKAAEMEAAVNALVSMNKNSKRN